MKSVFRAWLPLALSRAFLILEFSVVVAFLARTPDPKISIAAFSGLIWPIALLVESPTWMLLASSTALSTSSARFLELKSYGHILALIAGILLALICLPALYEPLAFTLFKATKEVGEAAHPGLFLAVFWPWLTADRRMHQGMLIRFGHSKIVGWGTWVRVVSLALALCFLLPLEGLSPILACSIALVIAPVAELLYVRWQFSKLEILSKGSKPSLQTTALGSKYFFRYYSPLALSSLTAMLLQPLASAILFRMSLALESVTIFAGVHYLLGIFKATARAYIEVVIARWSKISSRISLKSFCFFLVFLFLFLSTLIINTSLFEIWFDEIIALPRALDPYLKTSMLLYLPAVAIFTLSAYFQGGLIAEGQTKMILHASILILLSFAACGFFAVNFYTGPGVYAVICCLNIALSLEALYFYYRLRSLNPNLV